MRVCEAMRSVQYGILSLSGSGDWVLGTCYLGVLLYVGIIQNDFWISLMSVHFQLQLKSHLQGMGPINVPMRALHL
jgi:hypothetical protein